MLEEGYKIFFQEDRIEVRPIIGKLQKDSLKFVFLILYRII